MTLRKPLVLDGSGRIQQLQSGDTLNAVVAENNTVTQTADATLIAGQVVYSSAADHINKAKADAAGTVRAIGLVTAAITSGATGSVQTSGIVVLTTGQWDAVAGTTGGLTYNTPYYLSAATAGLLTPTPPNTAGQFVKEVGLAISTTELLLTTPPEIGL
jgi:hypothetical protein